MYWDTPHVRALVELALQEDLGTGDVSTAATVPADCVAVAEVRAKSELVFCGGPLAQLVLRRVDPAVAVKTLVAEGAAVTPGTIVLSLRGQAASILLAERTMLNFLGRMTGIATATRAAVAAVAGSSARILDTRKTLPAFRMLDKYAVRAGGGDNHRSALDSGVLLKDNHIAAAGGVAAAVRAARAAAPHLLKVEVEVESIEQLDQALAAGADLIMLDNMDAATMRAAVARTAGRARLEASGNMTLERLREVAATGVDYISLGSLTHSVRAGDLSLRLWPAS